MSKGSEQHKVIALAEENERLKEEVARLTNKVAHLEHERDELRESVRESDEELRRAMGSYVTAEVADEILSQGGEFQVGGERRVVTMLFTDIRRSTELSERMDANDYLTLINHYLKEMINIIDSWQGNVLGLVGDAIVVVFGAPQPNDEAPTDAIYSAVSMQRRMVSVNLWNREHGFPEIEMGIGIHTGEAILGTIGSDVRMKYDMIGRNVNLASRIEGFTHGGQILVSTDTLSAAIDSVVVRKEGSCWVKPKGIHDKVKVHDVIGIGSLRIPAWWRKS